MMYGAYIIWGLGPERVCPSKKRRFCLGEILSGDYVHGICQFVCPFVHLAEKKLLIPMEMVYKSIRLNAERVSSNSSNLLLVS